MTEQELLALIEGVDAARLRAWRAVGWLRPRSAAAGLEYSEVDVARVRLIQDLHDELALGEDAVPVVLSLVDQLYGLRRCLRELAQAVEAQPPDIRQRIIALLRRPDIVDRD